MTSSTDCEIRGVVWWIGVATLAALVVQLLSTAWRRRWLRGSVQWSAYRGDWAVVTGAAGGTGTALSEGLARRGLNLVLVSRNAEKLRLLADRLAKTHGVDVRVVVADFSKHTEAFEHIRGAVGGLCVSVLVNNAGGEPAMRTYLEMTAEEETRTWDTNVAMTLRLTRLLLPQMVSRHRGRVLCMSSLCSLFEGTLLVSYSSGKVYINQYCRALQSELRGTGVSVQAHVLGMVSTEGIANIPADGCAWTHSFFIQLLFAHRPPKKSTLCCPKCKQRQVCANSEAEARSSCLC